MTPYCIWRDQRNASPQQATLSVDPPPGVEFVNDERHVRRELFASAIGASSEAIVFRRSKVAERLLIVQVGDSGQLSSIIQQPRFQNRGPLVMSGISSRCNVRVTSRDNVGKRGP